MTARRLSPRTLDLIAEAIPVGIAMTAREVEHRLSIQYHRGTVRAVLAQLAREGRATVEGDITQRRYRRLPEGDRP